MRTIAAQRRFMTLALLALLLPGLLAGSALAWQHLHASGAPPKADMWTPDPGAIPSPASPNSAPSDEAASEAPVEEGALNVLLLGSDIRTGEDSAWRTDAIIIAAVRPQSGYVALFSIPRDLWVTIPGYGEDRINTADYRGEVARGPGGGPALLAATLQENLGLAVDAYVRIRFEGLVRVIDTLGGVTVTIDRVYDWRSGSGPDARAYLHLEPGRQKLDGLTALLYARDRSHSSDLDRGRRQQELLLAMRQAALRPAVLTQLPRLLGTLPEVVQTDLSPAQIMSLAGLALRLEPEAIRTRTFDTTMVDSWTTPDGAMVLLPHRDLIEQAWREVTAAQ